MIRRPLTSTPFPYTTLFRSRLGRAAAALLRLAPEIAQRLRGRHVTADADVARIHQPTGLVLRVREQRGDFEARSEEHTSELQSLRHLVCRLLLEKKKPTNAR